VTDQLHTFTLRPGTFEKCFRLLVFAAQKASVRIGERPLEQDHRAIKRRCASMAGFKSFGNAAVAIAGIELAHRIRKRQFSFGRGPRRRGWSRKAEWSMALA
jgi:transposase-like protein